MEKIMKRLKSIHLLLAFTLLYLPSCNVLTQSSPAQAPTMTSTQTSSPKIYATSLSVGGTHACAVLNNGYAVCWGDNSSGQLGDGTFTKHNTAIEVVGLSEITDISAGGEHTCALMKGGNVKCWGRNNSGQLGNGTKELSMELVDVPGLLNVTGISAGSEHTCAVMGDGNVKCWGKNLSGRVGNDTNERLILSPVDVVSLGANIVFVSAGNEHTCALTDDGNVMCWGRNVDGELGISQNSNLSKTPVNVVGLEGKAVAITTGFARTCAVTNKGEIQCWGWMGFEEFSNSPVILRNFESTPKLVATGGNHICAINENGKVSCLGENKNGQLGNGTTADSREFMEVIGLPNSITAIGAAYDYTCALTEIGEVWCWGINTVGQLGNGTTNNSPTPVKVIGINQ